MCRKCGGNLTTEHLYSCGNVKVKEYWKQELEEVEKAYKMCSNSNWENSVKRNPCPIWPATILREIKNRTADPVLDPSYLPTNEVTAFHQNNGTSALSGFRFVNFSELSSSNRLLNLNKTTPAARTVWVGLNLKYQPSNWTFL